MKGNRFLLWVTFLVLLTQLSACIDHLPLEPNPGSLRIKMLIQETNGSTEQNPYGEISEFFYDAKGNLSLIKTTQFPRIVWIEYTTYVYDNQQRVIEMRRVIDWTPSQNLPPSTEVYLFSYNQENRLAGIRYNSDVESGIDTLDLGFIPYFDSGNKIVGGQLDGRNVGTGTYYFGKSRLTYEGNNIKTASMNLVWTGPGPQIFDVTTNWTFDYDDKVNPFFGKVIPTSTFGLSPMPKSPFGIFHYPSFNGRISNLLSLSRNNATSDGLNTFTYTYNEYGLPTSRIGKANGLGYKLVYKYEPL